MPGMNDSYIKLIECPRDAMQGWLHFIPTEKKISYINALLEVGFDTIDFGSFVSPKAIPQMADTIEVISNIEIRNTKTNLLAIVANERGAKEAVSFDAINYLGFPFSISETFQQRNTNAGMTESLERVAQIQNLCSDNNKQLVVYISMGFGNPYGDLYNEGIVEEWVLKLTALGIKIISLADTVGLASAEQVFSVTENIIDSFPEVEVGVHLHSSANNWKEKADAALLAGCRRFDGAIKGIGGCPMSGSELVGNMNMENIITHFESLGYKTGINTAALKECLQMANEIFI
ncbi:MAG: hydroxymethylglutaryl-CoA lyase [Ferruginibacter sp.]